MNTADKGVPARKVWATHDEHVPNSSFLPVCKPVGAEKWKPYRLEISNLAFWPVWNNMCPHPCGSVCPEENTIYANALSRYGLGETIATPVTVNVLGALADCYAVEGWLR